MADKSTLDPWREQLRRGGLDLAILLVVAERSRYGLEIIRHLQETTDLVVTEGTIYPILARITRRGLVTTEWVHDESPHPRKYYRLTADGERTLARMIEDWTQFRIKIDRLVSAGKGADHATE